MNCVRVVQTRQLLYISQYKTDSAETASVFHCTLLLFPQFYCEVFSVLRVDRCRPKLDGGSIVEVCFCLWFSVDQIVIRTSGNVGRYM